jgi:hypothetical protein
MKTRDFGSLTVEKNSAQQFRRERWIPRPIQRDLIFLVDFVTRMSKPLREFTIVCEKKQTFSLRVETPDVEEPGKFLWEQIKDSIARVLIFSGRNKSGGFMQHDGKHWSNADEFAIDFDMILQSGLCAEVYADFTVDGDATRSDQFIAMPARSDACGGKKAVQTHRAFVKALKRSNGLGSTLQPFNASTRITHPALFSASR